MPESWKANSGTVASVKIRTRLIGALFTGIERTDRNEPQRTDHFHLQVHCNDVPCISKPEYGASLFTKRKGKSRADGTYPAPGLIPLDVIHPCKWPMLRKTTGRRSHAFTPTYLDSQGPSSSAENGPVTFESTTKAMDPGAFYKLETLTPNA
jgi:hypothetical protein